MATGTRLYGVPGVDGCACRCNAGFAGETCDVTDAPPPPLDVLADAPAGGLELLVSARPAGCGGVALLTSKPSTVWSVAVDSTRTSCCA